MSLTLWATSFFGDEGGQNDYSGQPEPRTCTDCDEPVVNVGEGEKCRIHELNACVDVLCDADASEKARKEARKTIRELGGEL